MIGSLNLKNKSKNLNPRDYIFNIGKSCNDAVEYIENLLGGID